MTAGGGQGFAKDGEYWEQITVLSFPKQNRQTKHLALVEI